MSNYLLRPKTGTVKETYFLEDKDKDNKLVYEAKMKKFKLFGAPSYEFINYVTNKTEEHKVGKPLTVEENNGVGIVSVLSRKSSFKYDGVKIWDYLHDEGIRIESHLSADKIGLTHIVSLKGKEIATLATSSPKGKTLVTMEHFYDVTCDEKDLDIVFLVAFSIAKTEQLTYN